MIISRIKFGKHFRSCGIILFRKFSGSISIGDNVYINSHRVATPIGGQDRTILVVNKGGRIVIGDNVGISNSTLYASNEIRIDDGAMIGGGCKIYDTDFHSIFAEYRLKGDTHVKSLPVYIGKQAFIGGHSIILKGVSIGDGAVIAAGSVVSKNIPKNEVWGGNPVKFLKKVDQ